MNNLRIVQQLLNDEDARKKASDAVTSFFRNTKLYPSIFARLYQIAPDLPVSVRDEIGLITGRTMEPSDVIKIEDIIAKNTCSTCGRVRGKCQHGDA